MSIKDFMSKRPLVTKAPLEPKTKAFVSTPVGVSVPEAIEAGTVETFRLPVEAELVPPPPVFSPLVTAIQKQIDAIDARIAHVSKAIVEQMYADTIEEALSVADKMRNEPHTANVADERQELGWLKIRRLTLSQRLTEAK